MESTNAERSESRRLRFSLRTIITVILLLPVLVGVAAAIDSLAFFAGQFYFDYHNRAWTLRQTLLDSGVPIHFVTHYYTLAYALFPGWLCLAWISFALGLVRSRLFHVVAVVLALATILSQMFGWFIGMPSFLGMPNLYVIIFSGGIIVFTSWLLGWIIRGRDSRAETYSGNSSAKVIVQILLFACILPLSIYGWWVLEIARSVNEN
ncbi:MAG: hypothetical protein N2C12_00305 [Planctomycetales bacterium]